jgi:transmembrane sensor
VVTLTALWVAGQPRRMATDVSQRTTLALEEGTRVDLNARTSLAVALRAGERRVALARGEAFFAVAPDVRRPFVVETPAGLVRVTGTRFNVRLVGDDGLQVTVLDGAVEVRPTAASPAAQLQPGDQFVRTARTMATRHLGDAAADVAVWREGKVVFRETPLAEALAAFAGYHRQTVAVDPEVAGLTLGGRYTLDDFESFLRSLERTLPVKVLRGEREVRIVAR